MTFSESAMLYKSATGIAHIRELDSRIGYWNRAQKRTGFTNRLPELRTEENWIHESATRIAHRRELDSRIGYRNCAQKRTGFTNRLPESCTEENWIHESATGIAHRRELDSRIGYRNRIHESPCERGLTITLRHIPSGTSPMDQ